MQSISFETRGKVSTEAVDVSNPENVVTATENTIGKHGKIEIFVASAGIAGPNYKSWEYPIDAWQQVIDINLTGVFICRPTIIPYMLRQDYGRIVNISSIAGKEGNATGPDTVQPRPGSLPLPVSWERNCIRPAAAKTRILDHVTQEHIDFMLLKIPAGDF